MSFAFGAAGGPAVFGTGLGQPQPGAGSTSNHHARTGPELEEIQAEGLGFLALSAERKLRLLPTPWPTDGLPSPTSSLMSLASSKGLLAAAGPDMVVVAGTESIRKRFCDEAATGAGDVVSYDAKLKIPVQMRVSQLAFSADENYLVLSAEQGGGLAVYDVAAIMNGNTSPSFELSTEGVSLRALLPNPTPEKAELFAVVTTDGKLLMGNLKERRFVSGPNGSVLKDGVSCVSWSTRGKQLVAGLGDGSASQMTPDGEEKAIIPAPLDMEGDQHVSSITWLENHVFMMVHTPTHFDPDSAPTSTFNLVTRHPPSSFAFQKLADPSPPFGLNRSPPHHFMLRLKDFPPDLQDLLLISSTASTDIGLVTRSKTPLTSEMPAEKITGVFTTTGIANDSRRAQLPMTEDMSDTSPIGMAIDLSSKSTVRQPIVGEEIEHSSTPLPALVVLNHEGVLAAWWVVYSDSIRQGLAYPGLVTAVASSESSRPQQTPAFAKPAAQKATFGTPAFGVSSQPTSSAFGKPSQSSTAFGTPPAPSPAFGSTLPLGAHQKSPWGASSSAAPAQPSGMVAFGTPSTLGANAKMASFGAPSVPGAQYSPWGTPSAGGAAFGQTAGLGMRTGGVFESGEAKQSGLGTASGFGSYASSGGFAATAAATPPTGESIFSKGRGASGISIDSGMTTETSSFGSPATKLAVPTGLFGASTSGFSLDSSFRRDGSAADDLPRPAQPSSSSLFGDSFGESLGAAAKAPSGPEIPEALMSDDENSGFKALQTPGTVTAEPRTPIPALAPARFSFAPPLTSPAADPRGTVDEVKSVERSTTPSTQVMTQTPSEVATSPVFKVESTSNDQGVGRSGQGKRTQEDPLAPDTTSKTSYAAGQSSESSVSTNSTVDVDAPLPPDFLSPQILTTVQDDGEPALPSDSEDEVDDSDDGLEGGEEEEEEGEEEEEEEDDDDEDFSDESEEDVPSSLAIKQEHEGLDAESDGVDVAEELELVTQTFQPPRMTPQSSFAGSLGGSFTDLGKPATQTPTRRLFGEVGSEPAHYPPHTTSTSQASPHPNILVRPSGPGGLLSRAEHTRSATTVESPAQNDQPRTPGFGPRTTPVAHTSPYDIEEEEDQKVRSHTTQSQSQADREQSVRDGPDEQLHSEYASEARGAIKLDPFIAHQDYVGAVTKPGIAGQIERLYRDIDSMVDTLGVNARSLQAFIKSHSEQYKDGGRSRDDLELEEDWCLLEIDDLVVIEDELSTQLDHGRVEDVLGILEQITVLRKDLLRVRAKQQEISKILDTYTSPTHFEAIRSAPLSAEQMAQQNELRKEHTAFQEVLATTEQAITLLRVKLASQQGANTSEAAARAVPTVEAVMRTIIKMTSMAEEKSGDVDVLENQMRRLRFRSTDQAGSREGSPFAGSLSGSKHTAIRSVHANNKLGRAFTPELSHGSPRGSIRGESPAMSRGGTPRKCMSAVTEEDAEYVRVKMAQRETVTGKLMATLKKRGGRVMTMDD